MQPTKPKKIAAEPLFVAVSTGGRKKMRAAAQVGAPLENVTLSTALPRLVG